MAVFDMDRPYVRKRHEAGDYWVGMYYDQPGVYYDARVEECSADIAREAGFNIEDALKERRRTELLADAQNRVERELARETEAVEEKLQAEVVEVPVIKETTADGSPRETDTRKMTYSQEDKAWTVTDTVTGDLLAEGISKADAETWLLGEEGSL